MGNDKLQSLQNKHPNLKVGPVETIVKKDGSYLLFRYSLEPGYHFTTEYFVPNLKINKDGVSNRLLNYLAIVESLSYWKLSCPNTIILEEISLNKFEEVFFSKLFVKGMSEFLYRNALPLNPNIQFKSLVDTQDIPCSGLVQQKGSLVLVGGGKDSVASLEVLKQMDGKHEVFPIIPFCLNPIRASLDCIRVSGLPNAILCDRKIDPQLLELNNKDYFNGHIPFSAVLSLISSLVAYSNGLKFVIASNESSANQGNVRVGETMVNHQYSKSFEFENDLSILFSESSIPVRYFSFLRPLNEIQISKIFSECRAYHEVFQSCNVRQTLIERLRRSGVEQLVATDRWCGNCPKCAFVYLMLNLFLPESELLNIFGVLPSKGLDFKRYVCELSGLVEVKPFECVGTFEEVQLAAAKLDSPSTFSKDLLRQFLAEWNSENFLDRAMETSLKGALGGF